jgi:hypothetical protein
LGEVDHHVLDALHFERACPPRSRPYPLCFAPPKGAWAALR